MLHDAEAAVLKRPGQRDMLTNDSGRMRRKLRKCVCESGAGQSHFKNSRLPKESNLGVGLAYDDWPGHKPHYIDS